MPKAIVSVNDTDKHDLKSLPGAYVVLRRMSYMQTIERQSLMKLSIATQKGGKDIMGEMAMASVEIQKFEFGHCIVEHNLEKDDNGTLLNLVNNADLQMLDPRVGQEIQQLIEDQNNFDNEELGD